MCATPVKRKLAAILATDAVGYSRLMAADEEGTMKILAAHRAVIDGIIEFHEGRIVGTAGDSVLAEFASPVEAVRCAVEIQDALKTRNDSLAEAQRLQFRIGVNLGDVMEKGTDLLGDGVNIAARLETIAEPGGICVSSSVYDQIAGKLDLGFLDIGAQSLKNIDRPIHVYRVERKSRRAPGAGAAPRSRPTTGAWLASALAAIVVAAVLAWYFDLLPVLRQVERAGVPAPAADERAKMEADLAQARAEAEQAKQRAEAEAATAVQAKRDLEEQRAAETRARAETELARARAEAEGTRRKADAELARAAEARRAAEADAKAAAAAKPPEVPKTAPVVAPSAPVTAEAPRTRVETQAPTSVPLRRYEGTWRAVIACEPFEQAGPLTERLPVSVTDNAFVVERGVPGQPGSFWVRGVPDVDSRLQLLGSGIAGMPQYLGKRYSAVFDGKFEGDRYEGNGRLGPRKCVLTISRAQ
ncbi:MAG: adenylate/guanylate cyclase domain-containing protein [Burkholderiales bacterium]